MRNICLAAAIFGYVMAPAVASPSQGCLQADASSLMSFDEAWDLISAIPIIRDEFERRADFAERQAQALTALPEVVAVQFPVDREHLRYDADAQALTVRSFALSNVVADNYSAVFGPFSVLGRAGIDVEYSPLIQGNIDVSLRREIIPLGTYEGQTGGGGKATIRREHVIYRTIFERQASPHGERLFFPSWEIATESDYQVASIPMPVDDARRSVDHLSAAVLFVPMAPYYATGETFFRPTWRAAFDRREEHRVLLGDIVCALVFSPEGQLLASIETR